MYGTYQRSTAYRFEVCTGDQYASVCDVGWDDRDAEVVCRDLGFFDFGMFMSSLTTNKVHVAFLKRLIILTFYMKVDLLMFTL